MLLLSVALGTGAVFASVVVARGIQTSVEQSFARMGADLIVVPAEAMVNITSALLTVQPTDATFDVGMIDQIAKLDGVAQAAPQTICQVPIMANMPEHKANLIAFEPANDITVLPWLAARMPRAMQTGDVLSGSRRLESTGQEIQPCNVPATVYGKLGRSGVGPVDESLFATYETVAALSRQAGQNSSSVFKCDRNKISAVLVRLAFGATSENVRFAIARLPGIKVIAGPAIVTSTRQTTMALLGGVAAFTLIMLLSSLILISLLFSAIISERRREIGLLRAVGARQSDIVKMLVAEAIFATGLGGFGGIAFGGALLLLFQRSLVYQLEMMHIEFAWAGAGEIAVVAVVCALLASVFGLAGAFLPAWRASVAEPYTQIQGEGG